MRTISPGIGNIDHAGDRRRHRERKALLRNVGLVVLLVLVNILVMMLVIKFLHSPAE